MLSCEDLTCEILKEF